MMQVVPSGTKCIARCRESHRGSILVLPHRTLLPRMTSTASGIGRIELTRLAPEAHRNVVPPSIHYLWVFVPVTPEENILPKYRTASQVP